MSDVLILLASFNGEKYIVEQLASIRSQSYRHWTLIVRDDASADRTAQLIAAQAGDERVTLLTADHNIGAKENFARLLESAQASSASYFAFADQDDVWHPDKLEVLLARMKALEQAQPGTPILVHSDLEVVDERLDTIDPSFLHYQGIRHEEHDPLKVLLAQNFVTGCTVMFNRKLLELAVPLPAQSVVHDWWLALLAAAGGRIDFIDRPLVRYRQHAQNEIGAVSLRDYARRPDVGAIGKRFGGGLKNFLRSIEQARALLARLDERACAVPAETRRALQDYAGLFQMPRFQRLCRVIAHRISPQHFVRRLLFYFRVIWV